jgi:cellulose synthase/poly-beta-1,6-N-acetylglucosamine synthase-like glycosyltransferase
METYLLVATIVFWSALILLVHCYILFPLSLPWLSEIFKRKPSKKKVSLPKVSILISAYNEESIIERKIENLLEIDYPKELLEILIGDDGSADKTAEIVERFSERGITLIRAEKNAGKAAMLNRLQQKASGEILLFCDANTMFFPNVVRQLIAPFSDSKIGCICGHLILSDLSGTPLGKGESAYWDLESEIKKFEGMLDRLIGGNGALYAIRRELYTALPVKKSVMDDFFVTVKILQKGYYCTFVNGAIGTEVTSKEASGEYRRKVRIGRANFNYLFSYLPLLNPFRPLLAYLFFSHKLLRWFSPHLGILCILSSAVLAFSASPFYIAVFGAILLFFLLALLKIIPQAYYFLSMNMAMLKGFFLSFCKQTGGGWAREARSEEKTFSSTILSVLGLVFAFSFLTPTDSFADVGFSAEVGTLSSLEDREDLLFNLDVTGHLWYRFDQMVFFGIGSGYQDIYGKYYVPVTASIWLRLPFGSTVLPVFTGDYGYAFGNDKRLIWKLGGGVDIKNGDRSSILILAGYEKLRKRGNHIYVHGGLLLEF